MSTLTGVVGPSVVTVVLPARNEPAAGFRTVAAAAFSAAYCELPGTPATVPLKPCGTAGVALEPQPAAAAQATAAATQAPTRLSGRARGRGGRCGRRGIR